MADALKVVAVRIQSTSTVAALAPSMQPQGPHFGVIAAEAAGPPLTRTILWDNVNLNEVDGDAAADLNLDVIEDAVQATVDKFLGALAIRIAATGATTLDPSGGTPREYTGLVVSVYKRTPIQDAAGTGSDYLLLYVDGTYYEDLAANFVVMG